MQRWPIVGMRVIRVWLLEYSSIRMEGKIFRNFADFCESKKILEKHG